VIGMAWLLFFVSRLRSKAMGQLHGINCSGHIVLN